MEAPDVITLRPTTNNYPTQVLNPPDLTYEPRTRVLMESPPLNLTGHDFRDSALTATSSQQASFQGDVTRSGELVGSSQRQVDVRESELASLKQRMFKLEDRLRSLESSVKWNGRIMKLLILAGGLAAIYWALTKQKS
ncbi:hypothetical protein LOD99_13199 [Oopsacas minuta]|uniref:Uncharacterized protein n=1 Tax=Oopsacas minuta TaxID=111878 RepID=A0AAV7JB59_9METZ|nr:hypothetical protein LOD99_13199 [Oopsacas minuta]